MPIYEYRCNTCDHRFERLVRNDIVPGCPSCESNDLDRLISMPRVKSTSTRAQSLRAAKQRDAAQATDRMHDRIQYEQSHDRHG